MELTTLKLQCSLAFVFDVPLHNMQSNMAHFVPFDCVVQRGKTGIGRMLQGNLIFMKTNLQKIHVLLSLTLCTYHMYSWTCDPNNQDLINLQQLTHCDHRNDRYVNEITCKFINSS